MDLEGRGGGYYEKWKDRQLCHDKLKQKVKIKIGKDFFMTSKSDKVNHGFGLKNVIAVVEKYHGEYYMESVTENGEATFQVSIGVPKAEDGKRL